MKKEIRYFQLSVQIALLVIETFAISFILHEAYKPFDNLTNQESARDNFSRYMLKMLTIIFGNNFVSALDASDLTNGVSTCPISKTGSICQEWPASECNSNCNTTCIPSSSSSISSCKLGTCYDPVEGTCASNSPKSYCEDHGGQWVDDVYGNIAQCRKGCCILGSEATFITSQQCGRKANQTGIAKVFKPEVRDELSCIAQARSQAEGACVFTSEFVKTCKFTTKTDCLTKKGDFKEGYLCSNPELRTNCEKQKTTGCIEGKDEIFWFDSCGNRENIYDSDKVKSWNSGKILSKTSSCQIGSSLNRLVHQGTCGNCDYLTGTICGEKTSREKLVDSTQKVVCRDLSCVDENGVKRANGESWCSYQGDFGVEKGASNLDRSVDTAGSGYFRKVCIDSKIRVEPCADYRNEVCTEVKAPLSSGKTFSSAACRLNRWQQCINYNTEEGQEEIKNECSKNPDCFVKEVAVGSKFKFNVCAPKYPEGFDLNVNSDAAKNICSLASQKCTVVYVKKISGWKCAANCECKENIFPEQMNDFCISLGDCGTKVNYIGDLTVNSRLYEKGQLIEKPFTQEYLNKLKSYDSSVRNKYLKPSNLTEFFGSIGIPADVGAAEKPKASDFSTMGMISGMGGVALIYAAGTGTGAGILGGVGLASSTGGAATLTAGANPALASSYTVGPGLKAAGGAVAGAAIGFAAVTMLLKYTGVGAGLDPATTYALLGAGAIGAGIVGAQAAGGLASLGPVGWIILAVVVIIIGILWIMGVGKTKKVEYKFSCLPWQAPTGGEKCGQCGAGTGENKLPCSKYQCQSLGQNCELINEGTTEERCININPNDVTAPRLSPYYQAIIPGFNFTSPNDNGVKIIGTDSEGCVSANTNLIFGLKTNEPAQCRMDTKLTASFDKMTNDFGASNLFTINHTTAFFVPNLESLGLASYNPTQKADFNIYVRCMDKSGNKNVAEYVVNFCIKPGADLTPPTVVAKEPANNWLKWNAENVTTSLFVNEPSECRWDMTDKTYNLMSKSFSCNTDYDSLEFNGFRCTGTLPVMNSTIKAFVRCKDQPWLVEANGTESAYIRIENGPTDAEIANAPVDTNEAGIIDAGYTRINVSNDRKRNSMTESYVLEYTKSASKLNIDYLKPNNETISSGIAPFSINFEASTSGGANGEATCKYKMNGLWIEFFETFRTIHRQSFQGFTAGPKLIEVMCEDIAGNDALKNASFTLDIDKTVPSVTRVYAQGSTLNVITDEKAECRYKDAVELGQEPCAYEYTNGTLMSGMEKVHSLSLEGDKTYYIKCKDIFDNTQSDCSLIVSGSRFYSATQVL